MKFGLFYFKHDSVLKIMLHLVKDNKYFLCSKLYVMLANFVCFKLYVTLQYQGMINIYFSIMPFTIYYFIFFF